MAYCSDSGAVIAGEDRLSKLSDAVLGHILSFLPAFDAGRTAVLSRRWRGIFAAVHTVSLDERFRPIAQYTDGEIDDIFRPVELPPLANLVTAALRSRQPRHGAGVVLLRSFRVSFQVLYVLRSAVVDRWVACAMDLAAGELLHVDLRVLDDVICTFDRHRYTESELLHEVTCRDVEEDVEDEDNGLYNKSRTFPAPRRLFSCAALRSLRLGPCCLDLPPAIDLPCLETLLLTRAVSPVDGVQRLVSACPRLADLTLEACSEVTSLRLHDNRRLRNLALLCCHSLTSVTVDAMELRVFEYRGGMPAGPAFLTVVHGPLMIVSCTLDFCSPPAASQVQRDHLRDFLQLFAGVTHLHLKSALLGFGLGDNACCSSPPVLFPECPSLRHLELTGISPDKDTAIPASVARILERTPSLDTFSLFFLPDPLETAPKINHDVREERAVYDKEDVLSVHWLRHDQGAEITVLDEGADEVPCLRERVTKINLVHYQGGQSQRTLAKFLLRHALGLDELCCAVGPGPLWTQCRLVEEIRSWTTNKSAKMMFV